MGLRVYTGYFESVAGSIVGGGFVVVQARSPKEALKLINADESFLPKGGMDSYGMPLKSYPWKIECLRSLTSKNDVPNVLSGTVVTN